MRYFAISELLVCIRMSVEAVCDTAPFVNSLSTHLCATARRSHVPGDRHPPPRARRCRHGARTPLKDRPHRPPRRQWQPDQRASRRGAACKSTPRLSTTPLIRDDTFSRTTSEAAPSTPRRRTTPLPLVLPARLWREALEGLSRAISSRPPEAGVSKRPWRACRSARLD